MGNKIFSNSSVPYICYHGTDVSEITVLDKTKIQKDYRNGDDSGYLGWGFYLTKDKSYAEEFGDNILEFFVNIINPFELGKTKIDLEKFVDFIFKDCTKDELQENIQNSLETIKHIGKGGYGDFSTKITKEISLLCRKTYIQYLKKKLTDSDINNIKNTFVTLAEDSNNWLNGLFFYFAKQLFHYFTINGYDGVIAGDGKEIVVYETKQISPINNVKEELELDIADDFGSAQIGDKFKVVETNDVATIIDIKQLSDDVLLIDYSYDNYIEDAPMCGSFKYYLDGRKNYSDYKFELLN